MANLPHDLYTTEQCRELDRIAIEELGMSGSVLMERAGEAAWRQLSRRWPEARRITVVCGTGNNGGDGYVVARLAHADGRQVRVLQVGESDKLGGDALAALQRLQGIEVFPEPFASQPLEETDLLVDALLGTGVRGEVNEPYATAIDWLNGSGKPILALDVPSGLDANTGQAGGRAVRAEETITFIGLKIGLLTADAPDHVGQLAFNSLNLPDTVRARVSPVAQRLEFAELVRHLPRRPRNSHKGLYGHVLILGGEQGMNGAARLAGEAALRAGAGRVSIATRAAHAATLNHGRPELMCHGVEESQALQALIDQATVVAVGPGLGQGEWGRMIWQALAACDTPQVVDADALNLLAENPRQGGQRILTPHPGEAARLLNLTPAEVQADRLAAVRRLQAQYGGVVVLKGAGTLVSAGTGNSLCTAGNPGMSSAGMGDVLTGVIAALLAQGLAPEPAAQLGVCLHGAAADQAARSAGERGLLAGDLFGPLRRLING
ncbi:NAD(P)H-hydrate dehydratase [Thiohalophilus thiocyanatoxydans]|uniref:Bifunctional NAD(P)H-hydrate repair enzyme n=1 Tax=Thiohalophilus thiocyanatoxydans TaxID=381308 RepID=A0A4R8IQC8_9GAMM|nr:NAD(P)H-hydrate dehydratase [Thiohalophilus thiocyanatoxydans]TDX99282.1 NAD(P)H-hydrate epimerase [Thiohalophilus thiocyanatoxydans]